MGNGRQPMRVSPEQLAQIQEEMRQLKLMDSPPQVDLNGVDRLCVMCKSALHPWHNSGYDGSIGGFCNKLCAKEFERKMQSEGMSVGEADVEVSKYEEWKPKRHSPVSV